MKPQSLLLRAEHVPHFVNTTTRSRVLISYKVLHRSIARLPDPLARSQLRMLAQHSFARFKYIAETRKIMALLTYSECHEILWAIRAADNEHKEVSKVLEMAYTTYGVKESPLKQILYDYQKLCDHSALYYKLNNIPTPPERTFKDHWEQEKQAISKPLPSIKSPYWQLVKLLKSQSIVTGTHKRKLLFRLEDMNTHTCNMLGEPIVRSRQSNLLKKLYNRVLRDAPRPVHPDVIVHIEKSLSDKSLHRRYRRRIRELSENLFTVDSTGKIIRAAVS